MRSVEVNGIETAYQRVGEGPALVLVHGGAADHREWSPQLAGLADELTVVAWDEPGNGESADITAGWGLADSADALAGLIAALDLGPAFVGGVSWGGVVCQELYRRHPEAVAGLVLVDTYAGWKGSLPPEEVQARVAAAREDLRAEPDEFKANFPGLFAEEPPAPEIQALMAAIEAGVRRETIRALIEAVAAADLRDLLPTIAVPTLLVWGAEDVRSPLRVAREFEAAIPGAELVVIPDAGHLSQLERPDEVNRAIRDFCRRHPDR